MFIIGLTGSLKTGKSTAAKLFKDRGVQVIDADQLAHQVIGSQNKGFKKVIKAFGSEILSKGEIDRKKLARVVFQDPRALKKLEKIIHPLVIQEMRHKIRQLRKLKSNQQVLLDVPLLFETGLDRLVDFTIVVKSSRALQIKRAVQDLNISSQQAMMRIKAQMPLKEKIQWADCVIDNNGSIPNLRKKVDLICQKVQQMKRK